MAGHGVIVEYSAVKFTEGQNGKETLSCSGVYLGSGWIISHGMIVIELLKEKLVHPMLKELKTKGCLINHRYSPLKALLEGTESKFNVIVNENTHRQIQSSTSNQKRHVKGTVIASRTSQVQDQSLSCIASDKSYRLPQVSSFDTSKYFSHQANVSMVFIQEGVTGSLEAMMPVSEGWRLTEDKDGEESYIDVEAILLSSFVLLKLDSMNNEIEPLSVVKSTEELMLLIEKYLQCSAVAKQGTSIYVESSPFGSQSPSVFLNSLSSGIISNIWGDNTDVYLTDARCIIGSEGAPVYARVDGKVNLIALVISPFCWKHGEWLGLSILAAIKPVLLLLHQYINSNYPGGSNFIRTSKQVIELDVCGQMFKNTSPVLLEDTSELLNDVVVGVSCSGGWGSGVIVNASAGIILTCAHVIQNSLFGKVVIITSNGTRVPGKVIYQTYPKAGEADDLDKRGSSIWDLAVVRTSYSFSTALPLAVEIPLKGTPVIVAGHGMFTPDRFPSPNISKGIISKIVNVHATDLVYPQASNKEMIDHSHAKDHYLVGKNGMVPVLCQTTCSVYAGNSGGPVVIHHPQYGLQMVGIMVCNTQDKANKATFPHINLAVPAPAIEKIICEYISSEDESVLSYLGVESPNVSQLWALGLTPQSHL